MASNGTYDVEMEYPKERIHILGIGNIGKYIAHSLANLENPPGVTLLFHRESLIDEFHQAGNKIDIKTKDTSQKVEIPFYESLEAAPESASQIKNLIVSTKTTKTLAALSKIKHRLGPQSTILLAQNGMGSLDQVNAALFPDPNTRPYYLVSVITHALYILAPFSSFLAGPGWMKIGAAASSSSRKPPPNSPLLSAILASPQLNAVVIPPDEILYVQLEKLVMNAMVNPLSAIFRMPNGEMFEDARVVALMRSLLVEASAVLLAYLDPAAEDRARFDFERLDKIVLELADTAAKNRTSMLQDVEAGRETEIDYMNGWLVKVGEQCGVEVGRNRKLVEMVKAGVVIGFEDIKTHFI